MSTDKTLKVFVIILNYNGLATLHDCLTSVFKSDYPNFEVIVVDNNSQDGSFEKARSFFSRAHFIKNSANIGFAKGNNVGIRFALEKFADAVFLLNNDAFIEKDTISNLVKASLKFPKAGIFSPVIFTEEKKEIWFAGGKILWQKMKTIHIKTLPSDLPFESEYITGCAMFVIKEVFAKIGLFDEKYFLYYEDADFSIRTKRIGFDLLVIPYSQAIHLEKSEGRNNAKTYWLVLSGLIFFLSQSSFIQRMWIYPYLFARKTNNFFKVHFSSSLLAKDIRQAYKDYKKIKLQ